VEESPVRLFVCPDDHEVSIVTEYINTWIILDSGRIGVDGVKAPDLLQGLGTQDRDRDVKKEGEDRQREA
jgi:hypothetical protein